MIELHDIFRAKGGNPVINGITARFLPGAKVGILGATGSGKSTLIRLLVGAELPDAGTVSTCARLSPPLGTAAFFHPALSGAENVAHLARILGFDPDFTTAFVSRFSQVNCGLPLRSCTPSMRAQLGMAFSLAIPFDFYLADEVTGAGDDRFRARCDAMLTARLQKAGIVLVSRRAATLSRYCDTFYALVRGRLVACENIDDAGALVALSCQADDRTAEAAHA